MSKNGRTITFEEWITIAEPVNAGQSSREKAEELELPLAIVRKWRQRYL